jgi:SAM-dependent methyltransferase
MTDFQYIGSELEVFQHATNWKKYYRSHIREYLSGIVLEVGGGIGATSQLLCGGGEKSWTILEPDAELLDQMRSRFAAKPLPLTAELIQGTLAELPPGRGFDAVLYIDVLEHIKDDRSEVRAAAKRLLPGGALIVLAPAHNYLFSEFDRAIGHFRRYSRDSLLELSPPGLTVAKVLYLDSVGMCASLANRVFLKRGRPTLNNILFWDSYLVRPSRWIDPVLRYSLGKSVLVVWRKPHNEEA